MPRLHAKGHLWLYARFKCAAGCASAQHICTLVYQDHPMVHLKHHVDCAASAARPAVVFTASRHSRGLAAIPPTFQNMTAIAYTPSTKYIMGTGLAP